MTRDTGPSVVLTGRGLTVPDAVLVARSSVKVVADDRALQRVAMSHDLLLLAAREGHPVYGLNLGVGLSKDTAVFDGDVLRVDSLRVSQDFNRRMLHSHAAGVGPELEEAAVRALMLARVNTMLFGATGCHPQVVQMYLSLLNNQIHPVVPSRGSVGVADITILPHIGLAMMGTGEVVHNGARIPADEALSNAGLTPLVPYAKDALSILSANAFAAGLAVLAVSDAEQLLDTAEAVFALSLEGLNGNVSPLLDPAWRARPYPGQGVSARRVRGYLEGSYLWNVHPDRALQDPLSFRDYRFTATSLMNSRSVSSAPSASAGRRSNFLVSFNPINICLPSSVFPRLSRSPVTVLISWGRGLSEWRPVVEGLLSSCRTP